MKKVITTLCLSICWSFVMNAQQNVGFNHLTGTANVSIPLYSVGNVPIGLSYSARGIRVRQVTGQVGLGWNLNAGGGIYREVKDLADDYPLGGWLSTTAGTLIENFTESYTSDCTSQADEHTSLGNIYAHKDTEPDVFYINTPFISGRFMFDNDKTIRVQPHQDLSITYTTDSGKITSFTVLDDFGVKYEFSVADESARGVDFDGSDIFFKELQDHHSVGNISLAEAWYLSKVVRPNGQYINLEYKVMASTEEISAKTNAEGAAKNYQYEGSAVGSFGIPYIPIKKHMLKSISTSEGESVEFLFTSRSDGIEESRLARIERYTDYELISSYDFYYKEVYPESFQTWSPTYADEEYEKRTFLASINPRHNGKVYAGYEFDYHGVYDYYNKMPLHKSSAVDIYGFYKQNGTHDHPDGVVYYNPALDDANKFREEPLPPLDPDKDTEVIQVRELIPDIYYNHALDNANQHRIEPLPSGHSSKSSEVHVPGEDRSVDPTALHYGSLSKLTYPTGGNVRFFYEANSYRDPVALSDYYGPGIRLQKTILHDGVSNKNNIVTNYSYDDGQNPSGTSGLIVERPNYAFGTPFRSEIDGSNPALTFAQINGTSLERAQFLSIRTNFDMSSGNSTVLYERVGVSRVGSGKTIFNFDIPATIDEVSANNGQWAPTEIKTAANNTSSTDCFVLGRFTGGANVYPFASNPNYNFERGLISSVQTYNETGDPVSETAYEYTQISPTNADTEIYGMTIDKIPSYKVSTGIQPSGSQEYFYAYGKYRIFSNIRNVRSKVTQTIYNPSDVTKMMVTTTDYTYDATNKRLSKTEITNSDGTTTRSYNTYVEDYAAGHDMIDLLQQNHQNGMVVESYSTTQAADDAEETVISGSVVLFEEDQNVVKPSEQFALNKTATISMSSFTPSSVSGTSFVKDNDYELIQTIAGYDVNQRASSTVNERAKLQNGIHWGYSQNASIAEISNAKAEHFLYAGFEDDSKYDFELDGGIPAFVQSRTGLSALTFTSSNDLIGEFDKDDKTETLILSFWLKATSSITITGKLKSQDGSTTHETETANHTANLAWKYYELEIDASALPTATYQMELSTNASVSIDDILLYPEESTVSYRSFGNKGELLSESIAGKTTAYYEYDDLLRNTLVRDDDKNILSKTDYTDVEISPPEDYDFIYRGLNNSGEAVFEFVSPEMTGDTNFQWNFGDNSTNVDMTTGQTTITHVYSTSGVYTVLLTIYNLNPVVKVKRTIVVEDIPAVELCASGPQSIDKCSSTATSIFQDACSANQHQVAPTIFKIDEFINCAGCENETITYDWQVRHNGTGSWTSVGTNDKVTLMYNNTFEVKCILSVGSSNPTIIESDIKTVTVTNSTGSCPDFPTN